MRGFSWVMAGIGIGVGLTIIAMNEYKEAEARLAAGRAGTRVDEEEWPLGKSFAAWKPLPRAAERVGSFAGTMNA